MPKCLIHPVPVLEDNYAYLIEFDGRAVVIDPGEAAPLRRILTERRLTLAGIVITHYDHDHTDGVDELRNPSVPLIGPDPAPFQLDAIAMPGSACDLGGLSFEVIDTPGHAFPHAAYHLAEDLVLFSGDCLFGAGCGRVAGGAMDEMWRSLQKLNTLPDETLVYCGHEYSLSNLAFAGHMEPDNPDIATRVVRVRERLRLGLPGVPSTMAEERSTNPFLRSRSQTIRQKLGLTQATDAEVFRALRLQKNSFRG